VTLSKKAKAGKKGGKAGVGAAKDRGTDHYRLMARLSAEKRRANKAARLIDTNLSNE